MTSEGATGTTLGATPRRRGPKVMTVLSLIAAAIAAGTAMAAATYYYNRPVTLRIAVGPVNSDDYKLVQSIARVFDPQAAGRDRSSIRLRVVPTEGSVQSAVTMEAGQADLAVVRGDQKLPSDAAAVGVASMQGEWPVRGLRESTAAQTDDLGRDWMTSSCLR